LLYGIAIFFDVLQLIFYVFFIGAIINPFVGILKIGTINLILLTRGGGVFRRPGRFLNIFFSYLVGWIPLIDLISLWWFIRSIRKEDKERAATEREAENKAKTAQQNQASREAAATLNTAAEAKHREELEAEATS
jgi:hypothetical protein